ncbi:probable isp4 protein [Fusarium mangiferae]|uniref:Probable isp4 protein n=1 Tax=Fusarium mangiferae TaxID=192010 RepID=A0A1L7SQJ1_FUSMA|nr:putative isp4 protein [Fusarium mangiferae]CVK88654.1 probable isp4 protein [Fusarium mangiferae]
MPKNKKLGPVLPAEAVGQSIGGPSGRLSTSLEIEDSSNENLKHRLHEWASSSGARNDDDAGSEYEMLMDPNLPQEYETRRKSSGESGDEAALLSDDADDEEEENSPYPEVRAAVRNFDEDLPCNTVRAWTIGLMLVTLGASTNTLLSLRQPSISIGPLIAQIVAWPMGHGWSKFVSNREFNTFGITWTLNPGPFNVKEHAIIVVMASVSFSVAYATDIILAQVVFYKQDFGLVFQLLLTISTQSVGYGIAGMLRKFLVYPASMIWPENLVGVTLMNAMYETNDAPDPTILGGRMHRYKWFAIVTACSFVYYFIPGFLAQFLSIFAVATWMAPQNPIVNQLFGGQTGVSILPITFDWTQIAGYVGSPLIPPWHAIANTVIGVVLFFVIGSSFLHYGGAWYAEYLPMSDSGTYDNTGMAYNTTRILTKDFKLDEEEYKNYSPLFISTTFAISYGLSFAAISSLIVYTYLHNGKQIWQQWRNSTNEKPDIHMKLMRKYKEAPTWWYLSLFAIMLLIGFYTVLVYPTNLSWWAFLLAIAISFGFALPIGIIQAVTNTQIGLNVLTEFIYGYLQPGRPLGAITSFCLGLEVRTLHEDPPSNHVHVSSRCHYILVLHTDRRSKPVTERNRGRVRTRSSRSFHVSWWPSLLCCLSHLGPSRTCTHVFPWSGILWPLRLLHLGCHYTNSYLCLSQAMAEVSGAISHGTPNIWRCRSNPACNTAELSLMGHCWLRLPVLDQEAPLQVVDQTQLPNVVSSRSRSRPSDFVHLLCFYAAWCRSAKLVGEQYCHFDDGRPGDRDTSSCTRWRAIRA